MDPRPNDSDRRATTRRRLLTAATGALAAGLAGCLDGPTDGEASTQTAAPTVGTLGPTHTWIDDPYTRLDAPEREGESDGPVTGAATLDAGFFTEYELRLGLPTRVHITVSTEGSEMDVYLLDAESFSHYRSGESVAFSDWVAETGIDSVTGTALVEPGRYHVVFDNSAAYGSEPGGSVRFEFRIDTRVENPLTTTAVSPTVVDSEGSQPKIRAVEDGFGNEFRTERDASDSFRVEEEVVLTDETRIELCVTEIAAASAEAVTYRYEFLERNHPYNTGQFVAPNCWGWRLGRDDYQSRWTFRVLLRNQDEIGYRGGGYESDFGVSVTYENLRLAE